MRICWAGVEVKVFGLFNRNVHKIAQTQVVCLGVDADFVVHIW